MKIAIIGAGTCGLYLAWKLAKKREDVTVFEKNNGIAEKVCSGLFSQRVLDFIPEAKGLIEKEINSAKIHFPEKTITLDFSKKFLLIDHSKLDNLLFDLARNAGAKIIFNKKISELPTGYDRVIGCDGAESFLRKYLKLSSPFFRLGIQGFVNTSSKENFADTWPCKNGFLWKIPRQDKTEYGIIGNMDEAYKIFNDFLKKNKINLENIKAKIIPQGLIIPKNKKIALCGDAAGLTKPWSGGGVVWALTSADILLKNFPNFKAYSKKTKEFFSPKIIVSKFITKIVYFLGFRLPFLLPKNNRIDPDFLVS
jgi:electron-transferring-flavoprotein dehydrogenase